MPSISKFSPKVISSIGYYVYCLVDPRDNSVFYVGKGCGNRVFDHAKAAQAMNDTYQEGESLKIKKINDILSSGKEVLYWIIRHHLSEEEAYLVESVLIDWMTYDGFNLKACLANVQSGHHQWDDGIKTVDEIETLYGSLPIGPISEKVIAFKIQRTYSTSDSRLKLRHPNVYEMTRKYWRISIRRAKKAELAFGVSDGIVRGVFKDLSWDTVKDNISDNYNRVFFVGTEVPNSPYLNKDISSLMKGQNPVKYFNF